MHPDYRILTFNVCFAIELSNVNLAVLLQIFVNEICHLKMRKRNEYDGKTWAKISIEDLCEMAPYLSKKQVTSLLNKLIRLGILIRNVYDTNVNPVPWHAFCQEEKFFGTGGKKNIPIHEKNDLFKSANSVQ